MAPTKRRKPMSETSVTLQFRCPADLLALIDAELARLVAEKPGAAFTRTDVIRSSLYTALSKPKR